MVGEDQLGPRPQYARGEKEAQRVDDKDSDRLSAELEKSTYMGPQGIFGEDREDICKWQCGG